MFLTLKKIFVFDCLVIFYLTNNKLKSDYFEKFVARLEKTSISMLNYNKFFKLLTYGNSKEVYLSAGEVAKYWNDLGGKYDEKILQFIFYFPYCAQKCLYCRERSEKIKNCKEVVDFILDAEKEMEFFSSIFRNREIDYFTFNGGSPDVLSHNQLRLVLTSLFLKFKFKKDAVKRIEFNPTGVSSKKLEIVKEFGFNRISFGVQSLSKKALKNAGRPYAELETIKEIISLTRKMGLDDINIDLILGLPGESYAQFEDGLRELCELKPAQIMVYILNEPNRRYLSKYPSMSIETFQVSVEKMVSKFLKSTFLDELKEMNYVLVPDKDNLNYKYFALVRRDLSARAWLGAMDSYINISTFIVGKKNTSNIFSDLIYERVADFNTKDKIYKASIIDEEYEMKKFIFSSVESSRQLNVDLFRKVFGVSIEEKFNIAIKILREKKRIAAKKGVISFLGRNSRDIIIDLAFLISNMEKKSQK